MSWPMVARAVRLAFLLRVPLLTLGLLAVFGPIARSNDLLDNLFDVGRHPHDAGVIAFTTFLLAFTAIATLNLTLHYASDRLDEHNAPRLSPRRPLLTFILGTFAASVMASCVVYRTEYFRPTTALWSLLGAVAAFTLVVVAKIVQLALTDPATTPHPPPFLVFPAYLVPKAEAWFDRLYCWRSPIALRLKTRFGAVSQWPLELLRDAGQGYLVDVKAPPGQLKLRSGHVFALTLLSIAFAFYLGIGLSKRRITADPAVVPALAYLLLFCIVACWILSALTFFLDRYRIPLLLAVAMLALITAQAPRSDHFFRVEPKDLSKITLLTPAQYVEDRASKAAHHRLVFVATPGGGIQAAAWTAEVLAKLEGRRAGDDAFRTAVALISSVSGGSLGSMIYAASFSDPGARHDVIRNSRVSAIDEVAWGWTFADFWRAVLPWFGDRTIDRGRALEDRWAAINLRKDGRDTLLSDWAARGTSMPALIFNSMILERGQHVVFSTTQFPRPDGDRGITNFYKAHVGQTDRYDVRVATAARLSASFPYVAPAARPNFPDSLHVGTPHYVDGGYYDNLGVDALIGWLGEALEQGKGNEGITDVLILTIQHFPDSTLADSSVRGWGFQLYAPLSGLLSMWNAAPAKRDANEFELFADRIGRNGKLNIWIANIAYSGVDDCRRAPLSWKLSAGQQKCVDKAWDIVEGTAGKSGDLRCIDLFLDGVDGGKAPECLHPKKVLR